MPNQQLVDYVNRQLQVGVSREEIRKALLEIGWSAPDVEDAMKATAGPKPADPPQASAVPASKPTAGSMIMTPDIFQSKADPMFEPKKSDSTKPSSPTSPVTRSSPAIPPAMMPIGGSGLKSPLQGPVIVRPPKKGGVFKTIFIVILLLGLLAAGGEIYLLMTAQAELQAKLQSQSNASGEVAALAKAKQDLTVQVAELTNANGSLASDLSIFFIPASSTPTTVGPISIKGTLHGGDKVLYTLTTKNNLTVNIKNSKDAKVDAALKGLVGAEIGISGDHVLGSRDITVKAVNDTAIQ